jgi:serine/threonine-protein kinase
MNPERFFAELKRRNVYKVAVAYAVVAWLLIQAASILFPTFEAPAWVMKVFVCLVAAGFPIALVVAWSFEMTPDGLKKTENISPDAKLPYWSRRKFAIFVTTLALIAAALLALQLLRSRNTANEPNAKEKSVAVLPFENLSGNPENAYFADGIQDEILARLAKIGDLKVISRTSTQKYKSRPDNLRDIAQQLGVATILEGSVQRSPDAVRVTVQLINAANDSHLWAETYDRKLTDIFTVESEIARTIAGNLQAKLTGSERKAIAARPTENSDAHQLYLKGRYFWNKTTGDDMHKAIGFFERAIAADPHYALAFAGLADTYLLLPFITAGTPEVCYPKAKEAAQRAVQLEPALAEAHIAFAQVLQYFDFDYGQAEVEFRRGLDLNVNNAIGHWRYSWLLLALGRSDEGFAEIRRAVDVDPLSLIINTDLGYFYTVSGRYDEAIAQLRRTIEMEPNFYYAHGNLGEALALKGQFAGALSEYKKTQALNDDPFVYALYGHVYAIAGDEAQARRTLAEMEEVARHRYVQAYAFACVHAALGEKEKAVDWLEQSYRNRAGADVAFIRIDPLLAPLRGDARFEKLAEAVLGAPNKR